MYILVQDVLTLRGIAFVFLIGGHLECALVR